MKINQLQAYNAMYKLLKDFYKKTELESMMGMLPGMVFLPGSNTADPAFWECWLEAIDRKSILTKKEALEGMKQFLQGYYDVTSYGYAKTIIDEIVFSKECGEEKVPLINQWNFYLEESINEPEGTREYLSFGDPMENIPQLPGFNTVYKLLVYYSREKKSADIARLADNMLFLPDGDTTVDPIVWDYWWEAISDRLTSTRQEIFEATIQFLENYGAHANSSEAKAIAAELRSANGSEDFSTPLVDLWSFCLIEAINEPWGAREYVKSEK